MEFLDSADNWRHRIQVMAESMTDPLAIPPLIVEYRDGELSIRDGNTRHGAMTLKGWTMCWVIVWYNTQADYLRHRARLAESIQANR